MSEEKNYQNQINQIVEQAMTEKTFSLEIVEKIKEVRDGFAASESENERLNKVIDRKDKEILRLTTKNTEHVAEITVLGETCNTQGEMIKKFEAQELNLLVREKTQSLVVERGEELKEIVMAIIKPETYKRVTRSGFKDVLDTREGTNNYDSPKTLNYEDTIEESDEPKTDTY